jgi:hypothetical protein
MLRRINRVCGSCFDALNQHLTVSRSCMCVRKDTHPNSMDNSNPVNNTDKDNPYDMVWVRLYHVPPPDDGGTRSMETLYALDRAFQVEPEPPTFDR